MDYRDTLDANLKADCWLYLLCAATFTNKVADCLIFVIIKFIL